MMARSMPVKQQPQILQAKICNIIQVKGITLDVGIGRGGWTRFLLRRTHRLIGLDVSIENLQEVKRTFQELDLICGDALNLPFRSNVFDSVFAGYLLHHLPNLEIGLREAHRVLKIGGKFSSIDPNKSHPLFWLGWRARNSNLHPPRFFFGDFSDPTERPLHRKELSEAFSTAGFVNLKTKFFSSLPSALTERYFFLHPIDNLFAKIPLLCGNIFLSAEKAKQGGEDM